MPVTPTIFDDQEYVVAKWEGETGTPAQAAWVARWADLTVQTAGTGTVEIEGSMDGTTWSTLNDVAGNAMSALATGSVAVIREHTIFVRPVVTGGTATITILGNA